MAKTAAEREAERAAEQAAENAQQSTELDEEQPTEPIVGAKTKSKRCESTLPDDDAEELLQAFLAKNSMDLEDLSPGEIATLQCTVDILYRAYLAGVQATDDLTKTLREQNAVIAHLQSTVEQGARARSETLAIVVAESSRQRSTKLFDPPIFTGTDELDFDNWLSKIHTKLSANYDHFPTEDLAMGYVESRVGGMASKYLAPGLRPKRKLKSATQPIGWAKKINRGCT